MSRWNSNRFVAPGVSSVGWDQAPVASGKPTARRLLHNDCIQHRKPARAEEEHALPGSRKEPEIGRLERQESAGCQSGSGWKRIAPDGCPTGLERHSRKADRGGPAIRQFDVECLPRGTDLVQCDLCLRGHGGQLRRQFGREPCIVQTAGMLVQFDRENIGACLQPSGSQDLFNHGTTRRSHIGDRGVAGVIAPCGRLNRNTSTPFR